MSQKLTTDQSFQKFISNLEPTEKQRHRIRTTREAIDSTLQNDGRITLNNLKQTSFLTGSYARNTLIRPIDDIDLYVRVHYGIHARDKSPLSILRLMASSIRDRYHRNTKVDVDSPCVIVRFLDYKFEVVPAVAYEDVPYLYDIPARGSKTWMQCYPNIPSKWLSSCNHMNNGMFIPMIKILKQWNRSQKVGLKSFHLELLTERVFSAITGIRSYPQGVVDWMYCVRQWIFENDNPFIPEPGHAYKFVDEYLYQNRILLFRMRRRLETYLRKVERAWNFYTRGRNTAAKRIYRNLFGPMFPAPEPLPARPVFVSPKTETNVLLNNTLPQQPLGLQHGFYRNALCDSLANITPRSTGLLSSQTNNTLLNTILNPWPKSTNVLSSEARRNALIDLIPNYRDPFKK